MTIYANHWLYNYIPHSREELAEKSCLQKILWALVGNDDDGIFGEGPRSGQKWTERWEGRKVKNEPSQYDPGKISFKRFMCWQFRNPLHNFTSYVIGFKDKKDFPLTQCFLLSTAEVSGCKKLTHANVFPMSNHTGVYCGLHNKRPFLSWRVNLIWNRWVEGYGGWRPDGNFGFAFRFKHTTNLK